MTTETNRLKGNGASSSTLLDDSFPRAAEGEGDSPEFERTERTDPRLQSALSGHIASAALKFKIPGDVIARAVTDLPDALRVPLKWAAGYCRDRNLSCEEFGRMLAKSDGQPYSHDSVYAAFTGRRDPGTLEKFCGAIDTLRRRVEETRAREGLPFVETSLSRLIFARCRLAREKHRVIFIIGDSQIGKSRTGAEYARLHNHGETILVRMPTGGALKYFLHELALRLGIGTGNTSSDLRRRIIESFDDRMLLIIDEGEQCLTTREGIRSLEFAREISDRRKCGLVIMGALDLRDALKTNFSLLKLARRGVRPLLLPMRPSAADLNKFASSFGLDSAPDEMFGVKITVIDDENGEEKQVSVTGNPLELQKQAIKSAGLGRWLAILEDAADIARAAKRPIHWRHVIAAHAQFQGEV